MILTIDTHKDDIAAAIRILQAIASESSVEASQQAQEPTPSETTPSGANGQQEPAAAPKTRVAPAAFKWFKENHGEKLYAENVAAMAQSENFTGTGKNGAFTLADVQALFPPKSKPDLIDPPTENKLSMDDVRQVTGRLVSSYEDGRQRAIKLVESFGVKKLAELPEDTWGSYVQKAAELVQQA